ncbi:hypothetical protein D3C81_1722860 [compost metagenome]
MQEDQRPNHARTTGGQYVDHQFGAERIHTEAAGCRLGITNRCQGQTLTRAQQKKHDGHGADGDAQCSEVDQRFAPVPVIADLPHNRCRQALPRPATQAAHLRQAQTEDLRNHPGADGEVGATQTKHDQRRGNRQQRHQHA